MVKKPLRSLPITPLVTGYIKPQVVHTSFFFLEWMLCMQLAHARTHASLKTYVTKISHYLCLTVTRQRKLHIR